MTCRELCREGKAGLAHPVGAGLTPLAPCEGMGGARMVSDRRTPRAYGGWAGSGAARADRMRCARRAASSVAIWGEASAHVTEKVCGAAWLDGMRIARRRESK